MIGKIIKIMRKEAKLTQEELSSKVFLGKATLSSYEVLFVNNKNRILTNKNINRDEL